MSKVALLTVSTFIISVFNGVKKSGCGGVCVWGEISPHQHLSQIGRSLKTILGAWSIGPFRAWSRARTCQCFLINAAMSWARGGYWMAQVILFSLVLILVLWRHWYQSQITSSASSHLNKWGKNLRGRENTLIAHLEQVAIVAKQ